jgi:hypothetical protein
MRFTGLPINVGELTPQLDQEFFFRVVVGVLLNVLQETCDVALGALQLVRQAAVAVAHTQSVHGVADYVADANVKPNEHSIREGNGGLRCGDVTRCSFM